MAKNIGQICKRSVVTIRMSEDLTAAARSMREKHIGYLVVAEPQADGTTKPVGVLTDRDIVIAVVAREVDAKTLTVGDVMTRKPTVVAEDVGIETALQDMRRIGVRRLPVVGMRGQLVGVLSLDDVLEALAEDLANIAGSIRNEQRIEGMLRT